MTTNSNYNSKGRGLNLSPSQAKPRSYESIPSKKGNATQRGTERKGLFSFGAVKKP